MLKKTIRYNDLDGNEVVEDFYFNYNKAEIAEMEMSHRGGFAEYLNKIVESGDGQMILTAFRDVIGNAVGRRSEDGRRFIKTKEIKEEFLQSEAYSEFFMQLIMDSNAAVEFVEGLVPKDLIEEVKKGIDRNTDDESEDDRPAWIRENREPTAEEMSKMSKDELVAAFKWKQERRKK